MHFLKEHSIDYVNNQREEFAREVPRLGRAFFGLDKLVKNVFTAPGTSDANLQQRRNKKVAGGAMDLYKGYAEWLKNMQPLMMQSYGNLYDLGSQDNVNAMIEAMQRRSMINALMANRAAMSMFGNHSLAQGMGINAMNKGMDAGNAYMGQQYDPATLMNRMAAALGNMQIPLQNMQSLASTVYGQPQVPVGKSAFDYIAPLAGAYIAKSEGKK